MVERSATQAAQARVKALLATVRQLEEERGEALRQVAELRARVVGDVVVDDLTLARALVLAMPRHARRAVSPRVLAVMLVLGTGPRSVHSLREVLGIAQATTSEWIHEAVRLGLVEVSTGDEDRRAHVAQLTPKGQVYLRDRRSVTERATGKATGRATGGG
jgi:DNA-binding MarR family transcriptional regulator